MWFSYILLSSVSFKECPDFHFKTYIYFNFACSLLLIYTYIDRYSVRKWKKIWGKRLSVIFLVIRKWKSNLIYHLNTTLDYLNPRKIYLKHRISIVTCTSKNGIFEMVIKTQGLKLARAGSPRSPLNSAAPSNFCREPKHCWFLYTEHEVAFEDTIRLPDINLI